MYKSVSNSEKPYTCENTQIINPPAQNWNDWKDLRRKSCSINQLPSWVLEEREAAAIARRRKMLEERAKRIHNPRNTSIAVSFIIFL